MSVQFDDENIENNEAFTDNSKSSKYKKRKKANIIVFPDIKNKKKLSSDGNFNKTDVEDTQN